VPGRRTVYFFSLPLQNKQTKKPKKNQKNVPFEQEEGFPELAANAALVAECIEAGQIGHFSELSVCSRGSGFLLISRGKTEASL
jgi:hypothetical protein